jgi:N-acetylglucosaminyl-diphospho-decaprenol L-rhamnosyltransferase
VDLVIIIPVLNQVHYTRTCLENLSADGITDAQILVVDNGSTDETAEFLATRPDVRVIRNDANHGCAAAWNQGVKSSPATWTVILNNDVLIPKDWLAGLRQFAEADGVDVVSPASCEGPMDYDFAAHARQFMHTMAGVKRRGIANGACFMVHRRVFDAIGLFDADPRLGGYEDDEFFRRARQNGFRLAVTGRSFIHHFGSVTQKAIKKTMGKPNASLGDRAYYRKKYKLTWIKRQRSHLYKDFMKHYWRLTERSRYGYTLLSSRRDAQFIWR